MVSDGHILAQVLEQTPIGILILRGDAVVAFANQYVVKLLGCTKEDLIGNSVEKLFGMSAEKVDAAPIVGSILSGTLSEYRLRLAFEDRPDAICLLNSFCVEELDPTPDHTVLVVKDITKDAAAADLIEAKNIQVAKMNTELARSNAELRKVSELKSSFLSIASHELNTPLTSIKGYSDIIIDNMKEKVDPGVYRMIESISRAADRLHKVVSNILDVTKIEQGRLRLRPEKINLGVIMLDCIDDILQIAQMRGIGFHAEVQSGLPEWNGDKARMQQMFTNLFNNAVKFSPDGSSIEAGITLEGGTHFHITVRDHGIGIDKSEHKNIFDTFYEVGKSNRHSTDASKFMGGGSGLGLSIVKGIVERHGGRVWVESEGVRDGEFPGSTFHVVLPLRSGISWDDDETNIIEASRLREADSMDFDSLDDEEFGKPVILFIDPDKESIEIASTAVENIFDVLIAESGEQGLIIAFNQKPSLILMDSRLPGLDGYRICRLLRSQDETKDIPIAFFSAGAQNDDIEKCFASGASDFIVKPFTGRELVDKICRLLMKKKEDEAFK